ncbi:MAG TPA: hypothetical protein VF232_02395 [Gaiellaceae bacterium]
MSKRSPEEREELRLLRERGRDARRRMREILDWVEERQRARGELPPEKRPT